MVRAREPGRAGHIPAPFQPLLLCPLGRGGDVFTSGGRGGPAGGLVMSGYILKEAARAVTCQMDWQRGHLKPGERVTADLGWTVQPGSSAPGELVVAEQRHDVFRSWALLEGGVPGRVYMVCNRVRTDDERVLSRAIVLRIAMGGGPAVRSSR